MAKSIKGACLALCGLILSACQTAPAVDDGAIYLVRHAEKVTDGGAMLVEDPKDPPLTAEGEARAQALADVLTEAGVTQIWSTDTIRTRATAAPLAERLNLEVQLYSFSDLDGFAARLLEQSGETVLVVGHSNTTPYLVETLGGDGGTPIVEKSEYDRLYVFYPQTQKTNLRRYGTPSLVE
ncbi:MAG: phosphoglycerate mutase family protein [Pseudomonadota bacterium]